MKRILGIFLCIVLLFITTACKEAKNVDADKALKDNIKIGVIFGGNENDGYTLSHIKGIQDMLGKLEISENRVVYKYNISDNNHIYNTAKELADEGCSVIFGTSGDFEEQLFRVADRYPDVQFCNVSGKGAENSGLDNTHNYFVAVFQARYVSGVVAGMKLKELYDSGKIKDDQLKAGYIGAYESAEVRSGFTAFFLGVRSVVPEAVMEVKYTGAWSGEDAERDAAGYLIDNGCTVISSHTDTNGAAAVCEEKENVYFVGYNTNALDTAPTSALTSAKINWEPYYSFAVKSVIDKKAIPTDWCGTYADGSVLITQINENAAAQGTLEKVAETEKAIKDATLRVFDTSTFTVKGRTLTSTVNLDGYEGVEYIVDGEFAESTHFSAPSFNFVVDGVKEIK